MVFKSGSSVIINEHILSFSNYIVFRENLDQPIVKTISVKY